MRMWFSIVSLYLLSSALAWRSETLENTPNNTAYNTLQRRQVKNMAGIEQRQGHYRAKDFGTQQRLFRKEEPMGPSTKATLKCEGIQNVTDHQVRENCKDYGKAQAQNSMCRADGSFMGNPSQFISSTSANQLYTQMCPRLLCWYYTTPCPRDWKINYVGAQGVYCDRNGLAYAYHMHLYNLEMDTLYDVQTNVYNRQQEEVSLPILRLHTCQKAKPVPQIVVEAYGLGWIYIVWQRPLENCNTLVIYDEQYTVNGQSEIFSQEHIGLRKIIGNSFEQRNFHPCPKYPSFFCFIISENIIPLTKVTFKVKNFRFAIPDKENDISDWAIIEFTTDDKGQGFRYCPKHNFFLTLWFLIILIVIFLLLLLIAAILIGLLYKRKRENERLVDEPDFEEESIPPSNIFEKVWDRLKNFFNEMCPKPQKPPPPPPPPPPKPKKKPMPKPKEEPKPQPKRKPKPVKKPKDKTPSPTSPPPPPPPPPTKPKKQRGPRTEGRGREAATVMDTKRMASGVGGVRARRRRR